MTETPKLPDEIAPLADLAENLRWNWNSATRNLFGQLADEATWPAHDPKRLLMQTSPQRLAAAAADPQFVTQVRTVAAEQQQYLSEPRWYQQQSEMPTAIAYFSPEFGITEVLPQYSGGLGILAGDHLKAASDNGVPLIGVGLYYATGYFKQALSADGWQEEQYPAIDPHDLPLQLLLDGANPSLIEVPLGERTAQAQIWIAQVGRVPLLLLDANVESNPAELRKITDRLYGGGSDHRLAQEIMLGIGGVRAVRRYCQMRPDQPVPEVFHSNEGHAGFLGLERLREWMADGLPYEVALQKCRASTVFTTHTPVPAGIDRFELAQITKAFSGFDLPVETIISLGVESYSGGDQTKFNMAVLGFRLAEWANGVSQLHGEVSRKMFAPMWPDKPVAEVPIGSITNGVHHRTWLHPRLKEVLVNRSLDEQLDLEALAALSDTQLWQLQREFREELIELARARLRASSEHRSLPEAWTDRALDPEVITIGFARRVPTYKRLTLMLRDPQRLTRLLTDSQRPIQIVVAGKSHPADETGKRLIQELVQFADDQTIRERLVFLPDYDIEMARVLYPGCDVWLNNPLRPLEACGTSGMKAALNGAANLSIRDGWWNEWYNPAYGWEIPTAENQSDADERDDAEASALYQLLESEVVPMFYDTDSSGVSPRWVKLMRDTISGLGPKVLAGRMIREYVTSLYQPAAQAARRLN